MVRLRAFWQLPMSWRFLLCTVLGLAFWGCDPVREDRRIEFTASGDQVAFQHGSDGIFVADPKSGELHKVFDPDPSVIAVSTPNWSDDETRAIFATARDATRPEAVAGSATTAGGPTNRATPASGPAQPPAWEDAPAGRLFVAQRIVYTCWFVERKENGISKPVRLFDARCEHAGYVAANLAVRWDAMGKRVFFVDGDGPLTHAVWVYDMESDHKRRLFPPNGQTTGHVVFDLLGDGRHIVCVASGADMESSFSAAEPKRGERHPATANGSKPPSSVSGIWLGSVEGTDWWHMPESRQSERDNAIEGLSTLIAHRPVCSKDGRQLAFVGDEKRVKDYLISSLFRADVKDKRVERVFTTSGDIHDLHWSPDGGRLGFVLVEANASSLRVVDAHGQLQIPLGDRFVREFAGWNATGDKLAAVSEKAPVAISATRFDLLIPNPRAYDTVVIADGKGAERTILSGLQFTFPQWSPKRDQLSTWGTFQPSHLALTSEMAGGLGLGVGLRRGDPAAIVDVSTGSIRWLAINGDEMAQVGNYYLAKHDPAQAREWYRKADKQLPKLEPLHPDDLIHGLSGSAARRRTFEFLYYLCLSQLNEAPEAAQRLTLFDGAHRIDWPAAPNSSTVPKPAAKMAATASIPAATAGPLWPAESRREAEKLVAIAKALSIAQIFLSIDQPDAAQTWFSQRLATADANEKLADLTALSQLCLLAKQNQEFATLATDRLAPLLLSTLDDPPTDGNAQPDRPLAVRTTLAVLAAHSFGPLFDEAFLKDLPPEFVGQLVPKWEALRYVSHGRLANLCVNLFLHSAASRLGNDKERIAAKAQIAGNPFSAPGALSGGLEVYLLWLRPQAQPQRSGQF
jgi:hypothetical protein